MVLVGVEISFGHATRLVEFEKDRDRIRECVKRWHRTGKRRWKKKRMKRKRRRKKRRRKVEYRRHTSSVSRKMFGDVLFTMYASHFRSKIRQTFDFRFEHATRLFFLWQRPRTISAGSSTRLDNILRDNFRQYSFKEEFTEIARLREEHFTIAFKLTEFLNRLCLLSWTSFLSYTLTDRIRENRVNPLTCPNSNKSEFKLEFITTELIILFFLFLSFFSRFKTISITNYKHIWISMTRESINDHS